MHGTSSELLNDFRLEIIRLARKQENYNLSTKHLISTLQVISSTKQQFKTLNEHIKYFMDTAKTPIRAIQMELEYESAKLVYKIDKSANKYMALEILLKSTTAYLDASIQQPLASNSTRLIANDKLNEICSKSIIYMCNLFSWHHPSLLNDISNGKHENAAMLSYYLKKLTTFKNANQKLPEAHKTHLMPDDELMIGDFLDLSTFVCKNLAKSWFSLATWSYKQGQYDFFLSLKAHFAAHHLLILTSIGKKRKWRIKEFLKRGINSNSRKFYEKNTCSEYIGISP